ncbi:hypothetical protein LCGC14_3134130 [marine sediment metagenome]|uniref:HNH nuclease domain-containing protein n=1 Tax=marine sediment metagenome TaxID=412755 RepID=A0A0F8VYT5_9ZZZZ
MICRQCGKKKEAEFYPHNKVLCKMCYAKRVTEVYAPRRKAKKAEYQAVYYKNWYQVNGRNRAIDYISQARLWDIAHPKEVKAREILRYAIRTHRITKPKVCSNCGRKTKVQGHHPDYSKPLEVLWLCASCHKKVHLRGVVNVGSY